MPAFRATLGALFATLLLALVVAPPSAHAVDYDCADFSTQAEAQGYLTAGDPHRLDGDNDGRACEELPCPCSYGIPSPPTPSPPPTPSAPPPAPAPEPPSEPPYLTAYVACGLSRGAPQARECAHRSNVGAFFKSTQDLTYTVCVVFPTRRRLCSENQVAQAGTLYVNKVTTSITGWHKITWFAAGQRLTRYFWRR